jgi:iron(III) transport system permease protein
VPSRGSASSTRLAGFSLALLLTTWVGLVAALPMARLAWEGLAPPSLSVVLHDARVWQALLRTLVVGLGSTLGASLIGGGFGLLLGLVAVPGRGAASFLMVLAMLVPAQIAALAWLTALGPASPLLLTLGVAPGLGAAHPLHGPVGIIALLSVQQAPLVFLSVRAGLRSVPAEQVEAARSFGATPMMALLRVVLPYLRPALAGGACLAFLAAIGNFGTTAMLGIPARYTVLSVLLFTRLSGLGPTGLPEAAAMALLLAALAAVGLALQAQATRHSFGGTPGRSLAPLRPGRMRLPLALLVWCYLAVVLALPLAALVVAALTPAAGVALSAMTATARNFSAALAPGANTLAAFGNSLGLSLLAGTLLAATAVAGARQLGRRAARPLLWAIDLPYALPGVCVGVAVILVHLRPWPILGVSLYGTLGLILLAYLARFQALALKPVAAALARQDARLSQAAAMLGAGSLRRLVSIDLPLLAPAAVAGLLLVALTALNEITVSILLYAAGSQTLGVVIYGLNDSGQTGMAAAVALLALAAVGVLLGLATLLGRRLPRGALPWQA